MPDTNRNSLRSSLGGWFLSDRHWGRCSPGHRSQGGRGWGGEPAGMRGSMWVVGRAVCQVRGCTCRNPVRPQESARRTGFLLALPLPSLSQRDRGTESFCSRVVSPRGTRGPGGRVSSEPAVSAPRLLSCPQGRPACSQRRPSRPHPHCLSWLLRTLRSQWGPPRI